MTDDETRAHETPAATTSATAATLPPMAPVAAPATRAPGPSRARWILALGIVGVVVALTIAGALLLGGASSPEALRYVPSDAGFVAEVRMDLPGDQLQKVGNLLAHFPGFADQSTLPAKLDEAFGRIVSQASSNKADYVTDIKPWLNGPLFISHGPRGIAKSRQTRG